MFHDAFGARLSGAPTRWIEPPWKAILSNKGILPLLWEMFPKHPNLLPAYFEDDPKAAMLGSLVRAQAALLARRRQCHAGQRRLHADGTARALTGRKALSCRPPRHRCRSFQPIPGARKLAGRPHAVRAVGPRGRKPDHRQHVAVRAARRFCELSADASSRAVDTGSRQENASNREFASPGPIYRERGSNRWISAAVRDRPRAPAAPGSRRQGAPQPVRRYGTIEPAPLRIGLEGVGDSDHGFGTPAPGRRRAPASARCARRSWPWCPGRNRSGRCGRR